MNLPTCVQSFETLQLFWYTTVYYHFKIYLQFTFQLLKELIIENFYHVWGKVYRVCYKILVTVQTVLSFWPPATEICFYLLHVLVVRPKQQDVWHSFYDLLQQKCVEG